MRKALPETVRAFFLLVSDYHKFYNNNFERTVSTRFFARNGLVI